MRIAIISDIHSNLEAFTTALAVINAEGADEIVCLGDIVGYGANPNECVDLVRQKCSISLLGNHDLAAVDLATAEYFTSFARQAAEWTSRALTPERKEYLKSLPYTAQKEDLFFVHASPFQPEEWHYIVSVFDARGAFNHFKERICFVGHSHVAGVYAENGPEHTIREKNRYVVNVGSIGQPRDGNPRLSFGIFDTTRWEYRNVRKDYDIKTASRKILEAGLPAPLAERLFAGV